MKRSILVLLVAVMFGTAFISGCDETGTGGGNQTDPNVKVFNGLVVSEFFNQNSMSGVNLQQGTVVENSNNLKDIQLVDSAGTSANFYWRSGDLSLDKFGNIIATLDAVGFETKFGTTLYSSFLNVTKAQFDTISVIPVSGTLSTNDFLNEDTRYPTYTYFNAPLQYNTVHTFWLKGKSAVASNNIYGLLYLRSAQYTGGSFQVTIDVKINTAGQNKFSTTLPS